MTTTTNGTKDASTFDYIIIGGGTAGCALASRLSTLSPSSSICLLERGTTDYTHEYITQPLMTPMLASTDLQSAYRTLPQKHLNGRVIANLGGNVLSGSSAVNYGAWMTGHSRDYDAWAELVGDKRWGWDGMKGYLGRVESWHDKESKGGFHGFEGPFHTTSGRAYPLRGDVLAGFKEAGFEENKDGNSGTPFGVAPWVENWRDGLRQPAAKTYDLGKVTVVGEALVKRVVLEGGKAVGVELVDGRKYGVNKEAVVCAGTHRTPQVLMLSGIGPSEHLQTLGITPLVNSPEVGRNFFDHISIGQIWKLRHPEKGLSIGAPAFMANPVHLTGNPMEWVATGSVPAEGIEQALARDGVKDSSANPLKGDRAHYEIISIYAPLGIGDGYEVAVDGTHIATGCLCFTTTSRGSITLSSSNPADPPVLDPNYYATQSDRFILNHAMRRAMQVMETPAMQAVVSGETPPPGMAVLSSTSTDEELEERAKAHANIWNHAAGTCAMGKVVDSELKVKGVEGLRVCDASIFPAPLSAHYQAPIYAIAEKTADVILGKA